MQQKTEETFVCLIVSLVLHVELKDRILKGSEELFMRYGIKAITMDEVANSLGISKKTIYQHFSDKNNLVEEVISAHMLAEKQSIAYLTASSKNAIDELFKMSQHIKSALINMNPTIFMDLQKFYPKAWEYFQDHKYECIIESIRKNLDWGVEEGFYRPNFNSEVLSLFRLEQVQMAYNPMIFPASKFTPYEVHLELFSLFVYGIVTPLGLELYNEYTKEHV